MVTFINNNDNPVIRHFNNRPPHQTHHTLEEEETPFPPRRPAPKADHEDQETTQRTPKKRPPRVLVDEKTPLTGKDEKRHRRQRPRRKKIIQTDTDTMSTDPKSEATASPIEQTEKTSPPELQHTEVDTSTDANKTALPKNRPPRKRPHEGTNTDNKNREKTDKSKPVVVPESTADDWHQEMYTVPVEDGKIRFHDLSLPPAVMHNIADLEWQYCTPIQAGILPDALAGRDCTGRAQTGTGKTAAFLLATFHRLIDNPLTDSRADGHARALILAPTRELVQQIEHDARLLSGHTPLHIVSVYGGASYVKQRESIDKAPLDIVIATPGRLLDLCRNKVISLKQIEILVIDEADRMLDMGFIPDVRRIIRMTPPRNRRQTLLFSATLTPEVLRLAEHWLENPSRIEVEPETVAVKSVEQHMYIVENNHKMSLLYHILTDEKPERVLVFANRRDEVYNLCKTLKELDVDCDMISGALTQNKRERTLQRFKDGTVSVLIATDVAGRGLHVEGISHVINYTLPTDAEDYVHRIGRTGRAGSLGKSISFACEEDSFYIPDIEEYLGEEIKCEYPEEEWLKPLNRPKRRKKVYGKTGEKPKKTQSNTRRRPPRKTNRSRKDNERGNQPQPRTDQPKSQ